MSDTKIQKAADKKARAERAARKEWAKEHPEEAATPATPVPEPAPTTEPVAPLAADLVEDDGEMVTRAERDGRQKIRRELAEAKDKRKKAAPPSVEVEIEKTLDAVDPSWRARKAQEKAAKDADKAARSEKRKAERAVRRTAKVASGKTTRPEHSNTEAPKPTAEDKAAPAVDRTMARLQVRWCAALERAGKTPATVAGYRAAIQIACDHFGDSTPIADLTARKIAKYNDSDRVTKTRSGKAAAKSGVEKIRRTLRLALDWAVLAGWIEESPLQAKTQAT